MAPLLLLCLHLRLLGLLPLLLGSSSSVTTGLPETLEASPRGAVGFETMEVIVDGSPRTFELRPNEPVEATAVPFCRRHGITPEDCNFLVDVLRQRQTGHDAARGPPAAIEPAAAAAEPAAAAEGEAPAEAAAVGSGAVDQEHVPDASLSRMQDVQAGRIDYSRRVGAQLRVSMAGGREDVLQRYGGEDAAAAVERFCARHGLSAEDCRRVEASFRQLEPSQADARAEDGLPPPGAIPSSRLDALEGWWDWARPYLHYALLLLALVIARFQHREAEEAVGQQG